MNIFRLSVSNHFDVHVEISKFLNLMGLHARVLGSPLLPSITQAPEWQQKMNTLWNELLDNYEPFRIKIIGSAIVQITSFWIPASLYVFIDWASPHFSQRHKIQSAKRQPNKEEVVEAARVAAINTLLSIVAQTIVVYLEERGVLASSVSMSSQLPSWSTMILQLLISAVMRDIMFYYAHRAFHSKYLYTRIHKLHHKYTAPVSYSSQYAHPIEHVIANMLPIALPSMILHTHIVVQWLFIAIESAETATVHSGYDFFGGMATFHDTHHERFNFNYGVLGIMDLFHKTRWRSSPISKKK